MKDGNRRESVHFVGLGGVGMSALARILSDRGTVVSGSDRSDAPVLHDLERRGVRVAVGHRAENLNGADCVVVSAAIPEDNPEIRRARECGIPILSRAELLGRMMRTPRSVAVTGTHGKSTTSGMLASLLLAAGRNPTILLGADLPQIGGNAHSGDRDTIVAEVCEAYDSFLSIHPSHAVITNVEPDHLDYYLTFDRLLSSFRRFIGQVDPNGVLIGWGDSPVVRELMAGYRGCSLTYGFDDDRDLRASDLASEGGMAVSFRLHPPGSPPFRARIGVPGRHNVLNAMGAIAAARYLGLGWQEAAGALSSFSGTGRRLETVGRGKGTTVIDDYAHHPTEIRATLETVREAFRPRRLIALFQPHLYSRTIQFLDDFAHSFEQADLALFMEIYAAREEPIDGVDGKRLADRASELRIPATTEFHPDRDRVIERIVSMAREGDLIVCLGAGDITDVAREIGRRLTPGGDMPGALSNETAGSPSITGDS